MDSANILSILSSLGAPQQAPGMAAPATNVLQAVAPPQPVSASPTIDPSQMPQAADLSGYQAPTISAPPADDHPRKRLSVIDVIGRLADTFATVGGAQALYQPSLDAATKRQFDAQDHANEVEKFGMNKTLTQQQIDAGALEPQVAARKRLGVALGALADNPDAAALWPSVAEQAGITDPQQVAAIGEKLRQNPAAAAIFAKALGTDPAEKLGKNVFFGTDNAGKTVAYQVGPDGKPHLLDFGAAGVTPNDPIKVVNTGGSSVIVGGGGNVKKILPNTARPDTVLTTNTQRDIANGRNQTAITIAGMPARAGGKGAGKPGSGNADLGTASLLLDNIENGFKALHGMNALPGEGSALGQVAGAIGRSALGQKVGEQTGNAPAQKRLEIEKDINSLQSEMVKSLPASATRTKFEQEIQRKRLPDPSRMSYATSQAVIADLRRTFVQAQKDATVELSKKSGTVTPVARPAASAGWSLVKVH